MLYQEKNKLDKKSSKLAKRYVESDIEKLDISDEKYK